MCFLIHQDEQIPEKSRNVFGMLANRMITKAADVAPSDKVSKDGIKRDDLTRNRPSIMSKNSVCWLMYLSERMMLPNSLSCVGMTV